MPDEENFARIAFMTEYDGTKFVGFQRQKNGRSVQQVLEEALSILYRCPITVYGCSRTDSGVHAKAHVSHIDVPFYIPPDKIPLAVNSLLPEDVCLVKAQPVDDSFHARFSSCGKEYIYRIWNSPVRPVIDRRRITHVPGTLDLVAMHKVASLLEGEHDFTAFCTQTAQSVNPVRHIQSIKILSFPDCPLVEIRVKGKSFLYNMVRIIAGTIVYVGQGRINVSEIEGLLAQPNRRLSGKTMPAKGLTLEKVFYRPELFA